MAEFTFHANGIDAITGEVNWLPPLGRPRDNPVKKDDVVTLRGVIRTRFEGRSPFPTDPQAGPPFTYDEKPAKGGVSETVAVAGTDPPAHFHFFCVVGNIEARVGDDIVVGS